MNCLRRHMCWQSKRFYWERAPGRRAAGNPGEQLCHMACSFGFMMMGLVSGLSLANHSDSRVLPGGAHLVQPRWMPERRILGGGWTCGVSFWPFLKSSSSWRLISFVFLTRTSCHKTTHANGAWPGWAVSISVLPLTIIGIIWFIMNVEGNFHSN